MLLNNESGMIVVAIIVVGGLFTYTFYNIFTTAIEAGHNDSLVNTIPNLDTITDLPESSYPLLESNNLHQIDVGVQTSNINVETSIQTANILVDTSVQTSRNSLFNMFKEWLRNVYSVNSSDLGKTPTDVRVENWLDNLWASQEVSSNTINSVVSKSQDLVGRSVSEIGESNILYNITDPTMFVNILREPGVEFIQTEDLTQCFIKLNEVILSVDPNIVNYFI